MRKYTNKILDLIDNGIISNEMVLKELLIWLDEDTVKQFYKDFLENELEENLK